MTSITSPATPGLHLLPGLSDVELDALAEQARRTAARDRAMANHPAGRQRAGDVRDAGPPPSPLRLAATGARGR
jgi:hypothetical protein